MNLDSSVLELNGVKKYFPVHGGIFLGRKEDVRAVDGVSLVIRKGETLGLVGESGCGKSTLGRCIAGLYKLTDGTIKLHGEDISRLKSGELKALRLRMQMIFQDPFESLNSRHTVEEILQEKYIIHKLPQKKDGIDEISALLQKVGLPENARGKFPHEFSGGQRQRIGIARAISLDPEIIICDEPVSALDVSVQSQILNLLLALQKEMGLTCLLISHDLSVVRHLSDHIAVMYLGKIVETGRAESIYENPLHPYTQALISAIPIPDPEVKRNRIILKGDIPSPRNPPPGCRFHTRCPHAMDICRKQEPILGEFPGKYPGIKSDEDEKHEAHMAACHLLFNLHVDKKRKYI
ncbi:MAG: ABC transporter ATP-binding protein [Desulfamplus sp.]|nr:ABC transporter ATP-binding protein [Desulfamplus sp.]